MLCPYCDSTDVFEQLKPVGAEYAAPGFSFDPAPMSYYVITCRNCGNDHATMEQLQKNSAARKSRDAANFINGSIMP